MQLGFDAMLSRISYERYSIDLFRSLYAFKNKKAISQKRLCKHNLVLGQNPLSSGLSNNHDSGLNVTGRKVGVDTAVDDVLERN